MNMAGMTDARNKVDLTKWEAFLMVKSDNLELLEGVLAPFETNEWRKWRNFGGRTLYQLAEARSKEVGQETRCLRFLRAQLQSRGFVEKEVFATNYQEMVVDVPQTMYQDIEVPVPEVYYNKTLKHVPKPCVKEVKEVVEVPQYTWKEELEVNYQKREATVEIPRTTITEVADIRHVPRTSEEEVVVPVPMAMPVVERVIERPLVEVIEKIRHVPGERRVEESTDVIEVPYEVCVPKTEIQFKPVTEVRNKIVDVPYVQEKAVIRDQVQEVAKTVEVPETLIIQRIKYQPKFEMETQWLGAGERGLQKEEWSKDMWYDLHDMRVTHAHLTKENSRCQDTINQYNRRVEQLKEQLASERRECSELRVRLDNASARPQVQVVQLESIPVKTLAPSGYDSRRFESPRATVQVGSPASFQTRSTASTTNRVWPPTWSPDSTAGYRPRTWSPESTAGYRSYASSPRKLVF